MIKRLLLKISIVVVTLMQFNLIFCSNESIAFEWNEMMCETGNFIPITLRSVWGSSSTDVFFVGDAGHIFHYDGSNCYTILEGQPDEIAMLYDVWGTSGKRCVCSRRELW